MRNEGIMKLSELLEKYRIEEKFEVKNEKF